MKVTCTRHLCTKEVRNIERNIIPHTHIHNTCTHTHTQHVHTHTMHPPIPTHPHTHTHTHTHTTTQHSSDVLSNSVQVNSAHVSIWEGEAAFWVRYLLDTINTYRTKMKSSQTRRKTLPAKQRIYEFLNQLFALPVSMVTTVEVSDWSIQLRLDAGTLQSKEPVCRLVVASCAVNVQWIAMKEDSTTVR